MCIKIKKATFGKLILRDCANCKTVFSYQVANIQINGINNYLCDDCLKELIAKTKEYLDNK